MERKLILSLSKEKGDFVVQPFKGSGKGGQKRNKTMSACRIIHPSSGTIAECQEERSFEQNKKKAFKRLVDNDVFRKWLKTESARKKGELAHLEDEVDREMENIKIEIFVDGKWQETEWRE